MKLEAWDWNLKISPRRELHLALFAAMETCLMYAVIVFLTMFMQTSRLLTPLPFFFAYWFALFVGRVLPQSRKRWTLLQMLAIVIALGVMFAVARVELYPLLDWYDLGWLSRYVPALLFFHGITIDQIVSAGVLFVFIRGLGLAQRPLSLWFVGLQFRIGVVALFLLLLVASFVKSYDATPWICAYFGFALLSLALARMEEIGGDVRLGPRWGVTLVAAVAVILILGLGILQFFTLDAATTLWMLLTPLWMLMSLIFLILAIPAGYLAAWLAELVRPMLEAFARTFTTVTQGIFPADLTETWQKAQLSPVPAFVEPLAKTIFVLALLLITGYWLARALNRRMKKYEQETFLRESIGVDDDTALAQLGDLRKKARPRPRARHIAAESIRRIYAALIARAAEAGIPRRIAETPYEFLPRLQGQWHEGADDLRTITEAYVQVHYAEHTATMEQVSRVRGAWERVEKIAARKAQDIRSLGR